MEPVSVKNFEERLKNHAGAFHKVVPFNQNDKLLRLDFTERNGEWTAAILNDTDKFTQYVSKKISTAGARYGIGGYAEHRTIYSRSRVFNNNDTEPRRLHLGIDIWGRPYTAVMAPLDGIVHSFAFNNAYGDYGATIILTHRLEDTSFHTLYGHLSLNSLTNLREGQTVRRGDVFAQFGIPFENGHWPPHLHFQIVINMRGMKGDFPGVCRYSEKDEWLANSPDADLILQMMQLARES